MRNELQADRREREIGLEQAVELQDRLVVERDEVDVRRAVMPAVRSAELDRVGGEARSRASCA
jgi:hypothetical protein